MNVLPIVNSTCLGINTLIIHVYRYHVSFCKFGKVLCYVLSFVVKILYFGAFHIIMSDLSLLSSYSLFVFECFCCMLFVFKCVYCLVFHDIALKFNIHDLFVFGCDVSFVSPDGYCAMSYRLWFKVCIFGTFHICLICHYSMFIVFEYLSCMLFVFKCVYYMVLHALALYYSYFFLLLLSTSIEMLRWSIKPLIFFQ